MDSTTLQLPNGYTAEVCIEEGAESPWKNYDCEPPILTFFDGYVNDQGTDLSLGDLFQAIPARKFGPKGRLKFFDSCSIEFEDASYHLDNGKGSAEEWKDAISYCLPAKPDRFGGTKEYIEYLELCAEWAGIPYLSKTSRGYCQRDWSEVFLAATPEWVEKVGIQKKHIQSALEGSFDLYTAWAWGDVYYVAAVFNPDGEEIKDSSCGGFYGRDHEMNGVMEHCKGFLPYDPPPLNLGNKHHERTFIFLYFLDDRTGRWDFSLYG